MEVKNPSVFEVGKPLPAQFSQYFILPTKFLSTTRKTRATWFAKWREKVCRI